MIRVASSVGNLFTVDVENLLFQFNLKLQDTIDPTVLAKVQSQTQELLGAAANPLADVDAMLKAISQQLTNSGEYAPEEISAITAAWQQIILDIKESNQERTQTQTNTSTKTKTRAAFAAEMMSATVEKIPNQKLREDATIRLQTLHRGRIAKRELRKRRAEFIKQYDEACDASVVQPGEVEKNSFAEEMDKLQAWLDKSNSSASAHRILALENEYRRDAAFVQPGQQAAVAAEAKPEAAAGTPRSANNKVDVLPEALDTTIASGDASAEAEVQGEWADPATEAKQKVAPGATTHSVDSEAAHTVTAEAGKIQDQKLRDNATIKLQTLHSGRIAKREMRKRREELMKHCDEPSDPLALPASVQMAQKIMNKADGDDTDMSLTIHELQTFLPDDPFTIWMTDTNNQNFKTYDTSSDGGMSLAELAMACGSFLQRTNKRCYSLTPDKPKDLAPRESLSSELLHSCCGCFSTCCLCVDCASVGRPTPWHFSAKYNSDVNCLRIFGSPG